MLKPRCQRCVQINHTAMKKKSRTLKSPKSAKLIESARSRLNELKSKDSSQMEDNNQENDEQNKNVRKELFY